MEEVHRPMAPRFEGIEKHGPIVDGDTLSCLPLAFHAEPSTLLESRLLELEGEGIIMGLRILPSSRVHEDRKFLLFCTASLNEHGQHGGYLASESQWGTRHSTLGLPKEYDCKFISFDSLSAHILRYIAKKRAHLSTVAIR